MTSHPYEVEFDNRNDDPLGFTKQTAMLLRGLGAGDFLREFKKRNISTGMLNDLSKEDFMKLGLDETKAEEIYSKLGNASKSNTTRKGDFTLRNRTNHLIEILRNGNQQLSLIQAFMAYARLRLSKERRDSFVDADKPLRSSEALRIATEVTFGEIDEVEKILADLEKSLRTK